MRTAMLPALPYAVRWPAALSVASSPCICLPLARTVVPTFAAVLMTLTCTELVVDAYAAVSSAHIPALLSTISPMQTARTSAET